MQVASLGLTFLRERGIGDPSIDMERLENIRPPVKSLQVLARHQEPTLSDHLTDSEQEIEEYLEIMEEEEEADKMTDTGESRYYYGRNRFKWSRKEPTRNVRTRAHNIVILPSVRSHVEKSSSPL
nr:unnamed protein product [Callosobruchus analis]